MTRNAAIAFAVSRPARRRDSPKLVTSSCVANDTRCSQLQASDMLTLPKVAGYFFAEVPKTALTVTTHQLDVFFQRICQSGFGNCPHYHINALASLENH